MAKLQKKASPKSSMSRFLNAAAVVGALAEQIEDTPVQPEEKVEQQFRPALTIVENTAPFEPQKLEEKDSISKLEPIQEPVVPSQPVEAKQTPTIKTAITRQRNSQVDLYLTPHTDQILNELLFMLKQQTNRSVASTHIFRGLLVALQPHMSKIRAELNAMGALKRPSNDPQFASEREEFEKQIGDALLRAVKG